MRLGLLAGVCLALLTVSASGYDAPPPNYIMAEVTWRDAETGEPRTDIGQLWFRDWPRRSKQSRHCHFGSLGYYTGIKWFVPKEPGQIWFRRIEGADDPHTFLLHDHFGEETVVFAFDGIEVVRTREAVAEEAMDAGDDLFGRGPTPGDELIDDLVDEIMGGDTERSIDDALAEDNAQSRKKGKDAVQGAPVRFATDEDIGTVVIPVDGLEKIVFLEASGGMQREAYKGRFVQYSRQAKGDNGRVKVEAATYWGGPDTRERFTFGGFLGDEAILLAGNFLDLGFVQGCRVEVLGEDPPTDAYPATEEVDRRGRRSVTEPRRTATFALFSADLERLERVVRLPWGVATLHTLIPSADGRGPVYLAGRVGPHFPTFARSVKVTETVENPEDPAAKRKRAPGPDACLLKLRPDFSGIDWCVVFRESGINAFLRPDGSLLVRRGNELFFVGADGSVTKGPALEITESAMAVDPHTGEVYFGGAYRSGTGLEPYVNPCLYKLDTNGQIVWTAYGWSGPITGVEQHRLVSDSSVSRIRVGADGRLAVSGWSDGGNTVLSRQPYDMRLLAPKSGFASSTWGAAGGVTVRIANIIHMDAETMEVDGYTQYVAYRPTSDMPTLLNIYDIASMANGEVAITGGAWQGFIETHDAWVTPWIVESRENAFAEAKGGPFFTLFRPDFSLPRMSTITPGASGLHIATRGRRLLLFGGGTAVPPPDDPRNTRRRLQPVIKSALQPENGGGLDGYAILVDTQGEPYSPPEPRPPKEAKRSRRRDTPDQAPVLNQAARLTLTTYGKGTFDMSRQPRPHVVFLILDQDGNRYPSFWCGRNREGSVVLNASEDTLAQRVKLEPEGAFTLEVNRAAHKHGMHDTLPGGVWIADLGEQPILITIDAITDAVFAGSKEQELITGKGLTRRGESVFFDVTVSGSFAAGGREAPFTGQGRLTMLGGAPAFTLRVTFPVPGHALGLAGAKGEGITATLHTASAVADLTASLPRPEPVGELDLVD